MDQFEIMDTDSENTTLSIFAPFTEIASGDVTDDGSTSIQLCINGQNDNLTCMSDEDYLDRIEEYIFPMPYEWVLICLHILVFIVGLFGNALVCLSVYRNHSMRTVTNYFIVNLAVADFLVILICLPPTVLWDVTETWFFGSLMCKLVLYLQGASVSVSVLTLSFISLDRWYAICYPLRFKSTTSRAKTAIFIIWTISLILVMPDVIALDTMKNPTIRIETHYFTDCGYTWSENNTRIYQLCIVVILFVVPFILMSVAYYQIILVLWNKNIPGSSETQFVGESNPNPLVATTSKTMVLTNQTGFSSRISTTSDPSFSRRKETIRRNCPPNINSGQILSRRKAAKMLIAVVVMFGLCFLPVHLINTLRYTIGLPQNDITTVASLVSHWLCYANSAINPIIYNFMSGKFRREFKNSFNFLCFKKRRKGRSRNPANNFLYRGNSNQTQCENINLNSITHNS